MTALGAMALWLAGARTGWTAAAVGPLYALAWTATRAIGARRGRRSIAGVLELADDFDRLIGRAAPDLPEEARAVLREVKVVLGRLLPTLSHDLAEGAVSADEAMFVHESITRHLPDAIGPYLDVPAAERDRPAGDGSTPGALLVEQLRLIDARLDQIDERRVQHRTERLARHKAELERKLASRP